VSVLETRCMLQGDPACVVTVQVETARRHPGVKPEQAAGALR
jgi:hypothetical protein